MGRQLGSFADDEELDRPDLNKCPDCGCFFADPYCPLCGKLCPEEYRAGNRKPVKKRRRRSSGGSGRVTFISWYHSWWFIILMLFVFPLLGFILLFTSPHKKSAKIAVVAVALAYTLLTNYGFWIAIDQFRDLLDPPVNQKLSREEYIAACETVDPETFYRNPGMYEGKFVTMTVTVTAKLVDSAEYYGDGRYYNYYVCQNDAGTCQFLLRDCQAGSAQNLIVGDVIIVWGEGAGNVSIYDTNGIPYDAPCLNFAHLTRTGTSV